MLACEPECGWTLACLRAKQLLGAIASQILHHVDMLATAVVAAPGIALGVLVREHAARGLHDRRTGVVLAGNHLQAVLLALYLGCHRGVDFDILLGQWRHRFSS